MHRGSNLVATAGMSSGDVVLIHGGASESAIHAIQVAKQLGAPSQSRLGRRPNWTFASNSVPTSRSPTETRISSNASATRPEVGADIVFDIMERHTWIAISMRWHSTAGW